MKKFKFWIGLFLFSLQVVFAYFIFIKETKVYVYYKESQNLKLDSKQIIKTTNDNPVLKIDSIKYAEEMGRLDFISSILAGIGILIAITSIYSFFSLQPHIENKVRDYFSSEDGKAFIKKALEDKINSKEIEQLIVREIQENKQSINLKENNKFIEDKNKLEDKPEEFLQEDIPS